MKEDIFIGLTDKQMELINIYAKDNMAKLKSICYPLINAKHLPQMEEVELLDDAQMVLIESAKSYNPDANCSFRSYLIGNIKRSFYDWTRDKMRWKRCNLETDENGKIKLDEDGKTPIPIKNVSLDAPSEEDVDKLEKISIAQDDELSEGMHRYLESLTPNELKVANKIMEGYLISDLPELLHMSEKQVDKIVNNMKSFEKRCLINYCDDDYKEEKVMENTTMEKSKTNKMSISSIKKKIENQTLRFNHPLQRESDQWSNIMKGNLISDILQNNPIPALTFAEQIINGIAMIWDLDGKQRCTNACTFANDGFKVSKNVRRGIISYQAILKDDDKNIILDENGFPQTEKREYDIRGKKFSDLPEELQERFMDYNFEITQYLNCTSEDIAYHIARYNDGKPMNKQQKGIISLGEEFAMLVKGISALPFFKEMGNYTKTEAKGTNGVLDRVVVESVMTTTFLDDWKKNQEDMCAFLKENATSETFDNFEELVVRLSDVATDEMLENFTSKDSFIYFGLFGRFVNLGEPDERFIEFMAELSQSLHSKKVDSVSYDDLCENRSTKDKGVIVSKIELLTTLMYDFLGVKNSDKNESEVENNEVEDVEVKDDGLDLIKTVNPDVTGEDIEEYGEYIDNVVRISSPVYHQCYNALLAMTAYVYKNNTDDEFATWIDTYANENTSFDKDQNVNFNQMKCQFDRYMEGVA